MFCIVQSFDKLLLSLFSATYPGGSAQQLTLKFQLQLSKTKSGLLTPLFFS